MLEAHRVKCAVENGRASTGRGVSHVNRLRPSRRGAARASAQPAQCRGALQECLLQRVQHALRCAKAPRHLQAQGASDQSGENAGCLS